MDDKKQAPTTVEAAVERAAQLYNGPDGPLVFGDDVAVGVRGLASDAGPPTKILAYLTGLSELAQARRSGPLGATLVQWLKDQSFSVSCESDSTKHSRSEMQRRSWHDGTRRREFELHMKPSDKTRAGQCVRIYFDWDDDRGAIVVAWIGRHP